MPALQIVTNVKLDDPKPFVLEFSQVSTVGFTAPMPWRFLICVSVRRRDAEEAAAVHLCLVRIQREPGMERNL